MADRRVHAKGLGFEVVRYDKAGKWYVEDTKLRASWSLQISWHPDDRAEPNRNCRASLAVREAALLAVNNGFKTRLGLPGGEAFDRFIRMARGSRT